jgi:hypothetical protein
MISAITDRWLAFTQNGRRGDKPAITRKEVEQLEAARYSVYVYPRKKIVCVNGSMYFRLK